VSRRTTGAQEPEPRPAFQPVGLMSRTDAAEAIIQGLGEGDGIGYVECAADISEATGVELDGVRDRHIVQAAMRAASERMMRDEKVPGVRTVRRFGWVRMSDEDLVQRYAAERDRRGRRQFTRLGRAAQVADPEKLTGEARLKRDHHLNVARAVAGIEDRRARRLRPLPQAVGE
jgi:hypothetical protein